MKLPEDGIDLNKAVTQLREALVKRAIELAGWNLNKAAHMLNLNRSTLATILKKAGIERPKADPYNFKKK